ncbi:hypothetical protein CPI83_29175 (plasmid) [Rhodococcus sp. H-CA8f]|uniref:hypothetical protein n=1 Tax=Rhodococcus sp. H-CA8f TaxID=1727214 RepID=UPI000BE4363F|nr:hypothetical protein [Rhodococcus sp. H-CA8f]ATI36279.1 hypothetical protein CPI83_29175 [Rhodococcus sp. H-CA8f]
MRWLLSMLIVAGLAGALPLATSAPAYACSCVYAPDGPEIVEQVSQTASVFTGTVTDKREREPMWIYEFDVREVFSGDVGPTATVSAYELSASCGLSFEVGTEYIVFTSKRENPAASWSVNSCSATTQSTNDRTRAAAVTVYGTPRTIDPQSSVGSGDGEKSLWWVLTVIGGIAALGIVLFVWRLRLPRR